MARGTKNARRGKIKNVQWPARTTLCGAQWTEALTRMAADILENEQRLRELIRAKIRARQLDDATALLAAWDERAAGDVLAEMGESCDHAA